MLVVQPVLFGVGDHFGLGSYDAGRIDLRLI
jgi:hypothetical protein